MLTQLFEFRYLQTDPNPANFFYNPENDTLSVIDYGAGIDHYLKNKESNSIRYSKEIFKGICVKLPRCDLWLINRQSATSI